MPRDRLSSWLWGVVALSMPAALWLVFLHAPEERVMGAAQKIFYFHVPAAMVTFAGVFVLLGSSLAYLWTRDSRWDDLSRSATEASLLFCTLVLLSGPPWAKSAWGVWWTWEAKLTTTLILWILLVACLMVRGYAGGGDLGARLASVVAIVAAVDVPIIYKATEWWRGNHPVVFGPGKRDALAPTMRPVFGFCILVIFLLAALIVTLRYRLARLEGRLDASLERLSEG
jgi:heme exporter protein C